jgi:hypothetical protein
MSLWANAIRNFSAKVAAYQIVADDLGKTFTNRGATASVAFTLPPINTIQAGWWCRFFGVTNAGFSVVSHGSSDNIVSLNDATADSITMTTNSLAIGAAIDISWDGTGWCAERASAGNTYTTA